MIDFVLFWLSYVVQGTLVVTSESVTFMMRLSWITFVGSSLHILYRAQPTLGLTSQEHTLNMIWICGVLLSFASLLNVSFVMRVFIFFAYTSLSTWCVLYFVIAKAILVIRH